MNALRLSFDDGPDPAGTPAVLDALAAADATATFFVIAPQAERDPGLLARIGDAGHTIAFHCDEHVRHTDRDADWVAHDLQRGLGRLAALGVTPTLWRTPWGVTAPWTEALAARHGLRIVGWDVDSHDWRGDRATEMLRDTRDGLRAGAIVLAHDGIGPGAQRDDAAETAAYVGLAVGCARERGLALEAIA